MISVRKYQRDAIDGIYKWFERNSGNPLIVAPTGSGKSVILAYFIKETIEKWPDQRILILSHVKELVEQDFNKLKAVWPNAPAGINSAGVGRRDTRHPIIFAGIQSVFDKAMQLGFFDLILIDEAHLMPASGEGMYRTFLADSHKINPNIKLIGFTATPFRLGQGMLHKGEGALFTDIAYEINIATLVAEGYLAPLTTVPVKAHANLRGVGTRNNEYIPGRLEDVMNEDDLVRRTVEEMVLLGADRKAWIVFCAGVKHAENVTEKLNAAGISSRCLTGQTRKSDRDIILRDMHARRFRALVNVNVATTGFDVPHIDLVAYLRPTKSVVLYIQMGGRAMRIAPGKEDGLVLDFAGNISRHGPIDDVRPPSPPGEKGGEAPFRICDACGAKNHASATLCSECGQEFPPQKLPHTDVASDAPIMSSESKLETLDVTGVRYSRHEKPGKPPSLRVDYYGGINRVASEWVCVEHDGFARAKAVSWWARRDPAQPCPRKVDGALESAETLAVPKQIVTQQRGKFTEIIACRDFVRNIPIAIESDIPF